MEESQKRHVGLLSRDLAQAQAGLERERMRVQGLEAQARHAALQLEVRATDACPAQSASESTRFEGSRDGGREGWKGGEEKGRGVGVD